MTFLNSTAALVIQKNYYTFPQEKLVDKTAVMTSTVVYSSIEELKVGATKRSGGPHTTEAERHHFSTVSGVPPPLPPPNPKSSHSAVISEARKKPSEFEVFCALCCIYSFNCFLH